MSEGERMVSVLVISPVSSVMNEYECSYSDRTLIKKYSNQFRLLVENLIAIQVDFEVGDERLLAKHAHVKDGFIHIEKSCYDTIFVSEGNLIDKSTYALLEEFSKQGGRIIFVNERPKYIDGSERQETDKIKAIDVQNRRDMLEKLIRFMGHPRVVEICNKSDLTIAHDFVIHTRQLKDKLRIHIWNSSVSATSDVFISVRGAVSLYKVNLSDGIREQIPSFLEGNVKTFACLTIAAQESIVINTEIRTPGATKKELMSEQKIENSQVGLRELNCLTINKAKFAINGSELSKEIQVILIENELYASIEGGEKEKNVLISYRFMCDDFTKMKQDIRLEVEDEHTEKIVVNGHALSSGRLGWWIDKSIGEYDISDYLKTGENIVERRFARFQLGEEIKS